MERNARWAAWRERRTSRTETRGRVSWGLSLKMNFDRLLGEEQSCLTAHEESAKGMVSPRVWREGPNGSKGKYPLACGSTCPSVGGGSGVEAESRRRTSW